MKIVTVNIISTEEVPRTTIASQSKMAFKLVDLPLYRIQARFIG